MSEDQKQSSDHRRGPFTVQPTSTYSRPRRKLFLREDLEEGQARTDAWISWGKRTDAKGKHRGAYFRIVLPLPRYGEGFNYESSKTHTGWWLPTIGFYRSDFHSDTFWKHFKGEEFQGPSTDLSTEPLMNWYDELLETECESIDGKPTAKYWVIPK